MCRQVANDGSCWYTSIMAANSNKAPLYGPEELKQCARTAEKVARLAGRLISKSVESRTYASNGNGGAKASVQITVKSGIDLVTEVDRECEDIIIAELKKTYPEHKFVGEETTFSEGAEELGPEPTWVIDPLDGTTNFVHGYTFVCVSIGLAIGGVPVVGVIYNPLLDEMYTAWRGGGAFLNDKPITVASAKDIGEALVVNNIGSSRDVAFLDMSCYRLNRLLAEGLQALRMSGSAAMNLAHVACGRLDVYYEDGYGGPWDVAAGKILVEEAGGVVKCVSGDPFKLKIGKGKVIAGNASVVDDVVSRLRRADRRLASLRLLHVASLTTLACAAAVLLAPLLGRERRSLS